MLKQQEIEEAIAELENQRNHTTSDCAMLASLYSIRDHAFNSEDTYNNGYSQAAAPTAQRSITGNYGDSDFLLVVSGKVQEDAWGIMDDLMDTLRVVYPRVYDSVMRKLRQL